MSEPPSGTVARPARALAVYAHPDDTEVAAGGTLATWAAAGSEVRVLICTRGEKGTADLTVEPEGLAAEREQEVRRAVAELGVAGFEMLGYPDGEIENSVELRGELVRRIRTLRPDVVLGHDPTAVFFGSGYVSHHDHRTVGWATLDACAPASGSPLYYPDAGPPHRVRTLLLSGTLDPDSFVDVSSGLEAKIEALRCHRSQLPDDVSLVAEAVRQRAAEHGADAGVAYAEAFRRLDLG